MIDKYYCDGNEGNFSSCASYEHGMSYLNCDIAGGVMCEGNVILQSYKTITGGCIN